MTFKTSETTFVLSGTQMVINRPTGLVPGDFMEMTIAIGGGGPITTPTGWTASTDGPNGTVLLTAVYYRVYDGTEPASWTLSWTGTEPAAAGIVCYAGVDDPTVAGNRTVGAFTHAGGAGSTTVNASSIPTSGQTLVIGHFSSASNSTYTPPANTDLRLEVSSGGAASLCLCDRYVASGPSGSMAATTSVQARNSGTLVGFRLAPHG